MYQPTNRFRQLDARVRDRDDSAAVQLQSDLERHLVTMVRYTLRSRKANTVLARRILEEADSLPRAWQPDEEDGVVRHIARRVSTAVVDRARARPDDSYRPLETVCA